MKEALQVLQTLKKYGYEAYLVGGYPRDHYLGLESEDFDICTKATPEEIARIYPEADLSFASYGAVRLKIHHNHYEITTFRKEYNYEHHRIPRRIEFVDTLEEDLIRRDFIMNTLCIDWNGNYVDLLGARKDMDHKIIRTVGNSMDRLEEDALRILRAIRFASTLNFKLDCELEEAIKKKKDLLKTLSYERKREELDQIFSTEKGVSLILHYGLDGPLELSRLANIQTKGLWNIWRELDVADRYPFSKKEQNYLKQLDQD